MGGRESLGALVREAECSAWIVRHWGSVGVTGRGGREKARGVVLFVFVCGGEETLMGSGLLSGEAGPARKGATAG